MGKLTKRRRYARAAAKATAAHRDIAASKSTAKKRAQYKVRQLGTFGPASEVRRITPPSVDLEHAQTRGPSLREKERS